MKFFGLVLIILGSLMIAWNSLAYLNLKGPGEGTTTAEVAGYYFGLNFLFILGAILLAIGISMRKKVKRRKTTKDLLDSLPGDKV